MARGLQEMGLVLPGGGGLASPSHLQEKVVGIYYSAHWCPPCRQFTPMLARWYKHFKETSPHADEFEIVFASSDQSIKEFEEYHATMPWCAIPFEERARVEQMMSQHGVMGIPTLVVVGADGKIITKSGRSIVTADPNGQDFPWTDEKYAGGVMSGLAGLLPIVGLVMLVLVVGRMTGLF